MENRNEQKPKPSIILAVLGNLGILTMLVGYLALHSKFGLTPDISAPLRTIGIGLLIFSLLMSLFRDKKRNRQEKADKTS